MGVTKFFCDKISCFSCLGRRNRSDIFESSIHLVSSSLNPSQCFEVDKVVTGATLLTKPTFFAVLTNHKSHPFGNEICYIWPLGPWQLRLRAAPAATAAAHTRHLFSPGARVFAAAFFVLSPHR